MGQPITVVRKPTTSPGLVRFEINRSLSGMSHERYPNREAATGHRPVDELARRLFDHGGVRSVHIYSNIITVELDGGSTGEGLLDTIRELFVYYQPGVHPPSDDELIAQAGATE